MRAFDTGATRDAETGKLDYEAFLSPLVLERFARYMHEHRTQPDGSLRDGDNWQRGIPRDVYMKSAWRHFFDVWSGHRGWPIARDALEVAICAVLFNLMGYLHELLRPQAEARRQEGARDRTLERIAAARASRWCEPAASQPASHRDLTELDD